MKNRSIILMAVVPVLASLALLPGARAVNPAPDGCYPNYTTAEGCNALALLETGIGNTALGWYSLSSAGDANYNTGVGAGALVFNNADSNTAVGAAAMLLNTSGFENVANGTDALLNNDSGSYNDAVGTFALVNNFDGSFNNAFGNGALSQNIHASDNTAVGDLALANNDVTGHNVAYFNTAVGAQALFTNGDGNSNTAVGWQALYFNDYGNFNTANGGFTLFSNIHGGENTATGYASLSSNTTGSFNTANGFNALLNNVSGNENTVVGHGAGGNIVGGNDNIYIGAGVAGPQDETQFIRIGDTSFLEYDCFIAGIFNRMIGNSGPPHAVWVDSAGKLGLMPSSRRYKHDIKPMDKTSEVILALKPVTFKYNGDNKSTPCFGLIAEEVAEVNPDLVLRDDKGKMASVRYEQINAMLLNEFLKEHKTVQELRSVVAKQEANAVRQQKQIEALTAGLQKVSAQLELSKAAPQTVKNTD